MDTFIDGPRPIRVFLKRILTKTGLFTPTFFISALSSIRRLRDHRGLNLGDSFERWLEEVLRDLDFEQIEQLDEALTKIWNDVSELSDVSAFGGKLPPPITPKGQISSSGLSLLKLISTAMPVGLKFTLPEDLRHLAPEYKKASPARLVRTSMSIPGFFEPVAMRTNKKTWPNFANQTLKNLLPNNWIKHFEELDELNFLDGGLLSNLPSDSFREIMPEIPTIVVPLYGDHKDPEVSGRRTIRDLASDAATCVSAIRLQRDREVWQQNIDMSYQFQADESDLAQQQGRIERLFPTRMAEVNTGDKNWLNFVMNDHDKIELFRTGLEAAEKFLMDLGSNQRVELSYV